MTPSVLDFAALLSPSVKGGNSLNLLLLGFCGAGGELPRIFRGENVARGS